MFDYKAKPFNLSEEDIKWVESTFSSMTEDEKVKQLFCMIGLDLRPEAMQGLVQGYAPGGIMVRPSPKMQINAAYEMLQKESKIPMLTAANLESGGNGLATEGTNICSPLGLSATNNVEYIKEFATIIADEADAIGCNWAFAPVVDIDMEFRNPITNTRTFGDDVDKIITYGKIFNKTLMDRNIAVSIKHFPGDGVDERDQHLVTSINSLEMDEYERT
ncbi:MAG: hypothetical protein JJV90_00440, partial [Spiroplasma sp.]|nr:hypothetical protein [Mycoplasmatales bacterium]